MVHSIVTILLGSFIRACDWMDINMIDESFWWKVNHLVEKQRQRAIFTNVVVGDYLLGKG